MTAYKAGESPRKILEDHGFDISIIGERRIWSISQHIRTEYQKYGEFHEGYDSRIVLLTDITYLPYNGTFAYLSTVLDAFTKPKLAECTTFTDVQVIIDDYIDYYNNRRYQWHLAKLSPNELYKIVTTGAYPLDIPNAPAPPTVQNTPKELGKMAVDIDSKK